MKTEQMETRPRALVTGASEGIGRVFARRLAEMGYAVTVAARNEARLDSLLSELKGAGHAKRVVDLSTLAGQAALAKELASAERFQLLVNNAGNGHLADFAKTPIETHRQMIALNVSALVELSHAFLQRAGSGDGIIQVSSTLSLLPMPAQPVYSATKAFVTSFSEALWYQCREKGVHILNLCPGATATEFTPRAGGNPKDIPAFAIESPEKVVDFALNAYFRKSGPTKVSGWMNRLSATLMRFVPRKVMILIMGNVRT